MKKYNITVNGKTYEVLVEEADSVAIPVATPVSPAVPSAAPTPAPAPAASAAPQKPAAPIQATAVGAAKVNSPMPGTILDVKVTVGQAIKKGDVICVLEAMKMENDIPAPQDGIVASINVQKGASVNAGDILATLN